MDPKEYIQSGKLESYVLGVCSPEDIQEVECMARVFPEVRTELESLQLSMESYIQTAAVKPPDHLKTKIFAAIEKEDSSNLKSTEKIIPIHAASKNRPLKYQLAACILLFIVSSAIAFVFYKKNDHLISQINDLNNAQQISGDALNKINERLVSINDQLQVAISPDVVHLTMTGTAISPKSLSTIFWNKKSKEVFIAVNSLPDPAVNKQYQLWGIVEGKPVDLGVFDAKSGDTLLQKMKSVDNVTTFAVTLEKTGGSITPTLDQMYVAGNL